MSKKEEQLLSPEDHERLAAAALGSDVLRGRCASCVYPSVSVVNSADELLFLSVQWSRWSISRFREVSCSQLASHLA